ncbi:MAG: LptF/LptG family permease [Desulfurella sp.]
MFGLKLFDKYILINLTKVFFVSLIIITVVMLIGDMVKFSDVLFSAGTSLFDMLTILAYMALFLAIFTIPMSLMLSINLTYTQMSKNLEIDIAKTMGLSTFRIYKSALFFTLIVFLILFFIVGYLSPIANASYRNKLYRLAKNNVQAGLTENTFFKTKNFTIYANTLSSNHNKAYDVLVDIENKIIKARRVEFIDTQDGFALKCFDGNIFYKNKNSINNAYFKIYTVVIKFSDLTYNFANNPGFMPINKLIYYIKTHPQSTDALFELHQMFVLSTSVFILSLIGFVSALSFYRSGKTFGIIFSMFSFVVFYVLETFGKSLYSSNNIYYAIWLPNLILFPIAIIVFAIKARR